MVLSSLIVTPAKAVIQPKHKKKLDPRLRGGDDNDVRFKRTKHGDLPIPAKVRRVILTAARESLPNEACGLLLGRFGRIQVVRPTRNVHSTPTTHFEIDPQALIDAHRDEREGGLKLMGYFHSHPTGEPYPSDTDRALAAGDGKIWAIAAQGRLMFWEDRPDGGLVALSYDIIGR